ncbi:hypothetical protein IC213_18540 [Clostridioides sp. ES-S-0049-02]|uniref:hypothetical protein n=1 Tax=Clostridioides sp. ES-S-0049-02 TaxID=2770778 RepID=UPI001D0F8EDE|nr:hypothetical protein [Clostridioides sp. ES-S-0049-02]
MICPKCGNKMKELMIYEHHVKCLNCNYEEKDIYVINQGKSKIQINKFGGK